ncbi:MAG: hypothetical protein QMD13_02725 [Candidatus Bathyarchaeia archaeon]|nr:hypothetical protein [Candidatus Bathyarchaeia archaeon]
MDTLRISKYSPDELAAKGEDIYNKIRNEVEEKYRGLFIAIEADSGDYTIAQSPLEAVDKAREKHPESVFYVKRIGYRVTRILY